MSSQSPTLTALRQVLREYRAFGHLSGETLRQADDALLAAGEATHQPQIVMCADIDCVRYQKDPTDRCVAGGHAYFVRPTKRDITKT